MENYNLYERLVIKTNLFLRKYKKDYDNETRIYQKRSKTCKNMCTFLLKVGIIEIVGKSKREGRKTI